MTDTTSIATITPKAPIVILRERLLERRTELLAALPSDISPEAFIRALITSAQINPDIQACSWSSLWLACMVACRHGLKPDGIEGVIIPFKSTATFIAMYRGLLKRFRDTGQCKWIGADVVRAGETFEHYVDENGEHFKHIPGDNDQAPIQKIYGAALTRNGGFYVAVLTMGEIEKIKKMSRASREDAPWKMWPEEMMKKTALRRLAKLLPSGSDVIDDDLPDVPSAPALAPPTPSPERPRGAAAMLDQFGSSGSPTSGDDAPMQQPTDAGGRGGGGEPGADAGPVPDETAAASDSQDHDGIADDPINIAHDRGRKAKAEGLQRKAIPGEYREPDRQREAMAWQAGFEGRSMPEFTD